MGLNRRSMAKAVLKRYVVRKYIMAKSANDALKIERRARPDDVYIDDDWKKTSGGEMSSAIGFQVENYED